MKKFSMKCNCGQVMTMDANNRDEAVAKFKKMMTQEMLNDHWEKFHQKPTLMQAHMMIEKSVVEGELSMDDMTMMS